MKTMKRLLAALCVTLALLTVSASAEGTMIDPQLIFSAETALTVSVDGTVSAALSDTVPYGESVTLTAPAVPDKPFRYWTNGEGTIISYARDLTLTMYANTTLNAVYGTAAATAQPTAAFLNITRTDGEIVFNAIASSGSAGIRYSTTKKTLNDLKGESDVTVVAGDGTPNWALVVTPGNADTTYYAVVYTTIGTETTYSDVKEVKLSELPSGVSLIANLGDISLSNLDISLCAVTFDANGGTATMALQGVVSGTATKLNANTFTREGYTFNGWSTNQSGGGTTYSDGQSVTITADTTLYAQWRSNSSGSSSSSNSTTTKTITAPVTGDTGTVAVTATVKGTDAAIAPLTTDQVDSIVGSGSAATTVAIDVSNLGTAVKAVTIPAETVKAIEAAVSDKTKDADSLTVKLTEGSVTFDADAVKAIAAETRGDGLKVNLDGIGTEQLNTAQKSAVSDLAVETVLDAYVTSGSSRISDFKGGSATVSVKHTLKAAQSPAGIVVWYIADNGTRTQIPASFRNGEVVFTVTHFSNYIIAYDAEKAEAAGKLGEFTDLDSNAWYADGVLWALDNGVMNGVGSNKFNPNGNTSRAMLATMLWRLEGSPVVNYAMDFADVKTDTWYTEAVRWAASAGIISGYKIPAATTPWPMGFDPDKAVTREQLATMLYRYAQYKKADVSASASLSSYGDAASVSDWATSAMQWAVGSGIINGIGSELVPAGNATRAQVATMLMRYSTAK